MSAPKAITPPSPGDLLYAARGEEDAQGNYPWPARTFAGITLGPGEESWRAGVAAMSDQQRLDFWTAQGNASRAASRAAGE